MKTLAAVALALLVFGGLALAQTYPSRARISGGSGSTVTAPATGSGTDTCTGSGCAIGARGISADGGITLTGPGITLTNGGQIWFTGTSAFPFIYEGTATYYTSFNAGVLTNTPTIASAVASGNVAFQSLSGAKTCLGTSATACLTDGLPNRGVKVLSGGTGTVTVASGAVCNCSLNTSAGTAAPKCSVTTTTLTITGTGTDSINYFCF